MPSDNVLFLSGFSIGHTHGWLATYRYSTLEENVLFKLLLNFILHEHSSSKTGLFNVIALFFELFRFFIEARVKTKISQVLRCMHFVSL